MRVHSGSTCLSLSLLSPLILFYFYFFFLSLQSYFLSCSLLFSLSLSLPFSLYLCVCVCPYVSVSLCLCPSVFVCVSSPPKSENGSNAINGITQTNEICLTQLSQKSGSKFHLKKGLLKEGRKSCRAKTYISTCMKG